MPERSVGVLRRAGLGDVLLGTAAAWRYAAATGRTLRLDWRHSRYASAPTNLFSEVFQPMSHWRGVPVWLPPSTEPLEPYPPLTAADERRSGLEACELVQSGRDVADPHVVLRGCVAPAHPPLEVIAPLLRELSLQPRLAAAVASTRQEVMGDGPSIGVHLRHGNGGDIMGHAAFWSDGLAVQRVVHAVRRARSVLGGDTPVFLATDSAEVRDAVCALLPGVRTIDKRFRAPGAGELHRWGEAPSTLDAAVVEMWLLSYSTVLVRMPPLSYFSAPGAFMKAPAPASLLQRVPPAMEPAVW